MDKKIKMLFMIFIFSFCTRNNDLLKSTTLTYQYNKFMFVNLITGELHVRMNGLKYDDKLTFTEEDEKFIRDSYKKNNISKLKGEIYCLDNNAFMPPNNNVIEVFENHKNQSTVTININYDIRSARVGSRDYKIASFRNDIMAVLNKYEGVQRAIDTLTHYQKKSNYHAL